MELMSTTSLAVLLRDRDTLNRLISLPSRRLTAVRGSAGSSAEVKDAASIAAAAASAVVGEFGAAPNAGGLSPLQFLTWARSTGSLDCFITVFDLVGAAEGRDCVSLTPSPHPLSWQPSSLS